MTNLPQPLIPLRDIALNLWWTWTPEAMALFARLDADLWDQTGHNPVKLLSTIARERLNVAAADDAFIQDLRRVRGSLEESVRQPGWYSTASHALEQAADGARPFKVAYFCSEFGLTESFQIYAGGLGCLAGDHLKSASQLGLPLVAVGLYYRNGFFHQSLDAEGYQHEVFTDLDPRHMPVQPVIDPSNGVQRRTQVWFPGRPVAIALWRCDVGRVPLYLLDTDVAENSPADRLITRNLYLGDREARLKQEIVLGVGGVRALTAVGEHPTVFHMNEGHSAFLALERIRQIRLAHHVTFDQAREAASPAHLFTTHTPVPAGIDRFTAELMSWYFASFHDELGLDMEGMLALGRENVGDKSEYFSMATLALRASKWCNGVSRLHGHVSRTMWKNIWPDTPTQDVPIGHVTNGVHTATWLGPEMAALYDRHLAPGWRARPEEAGAWAAIDSIPDPALWQARAAARHRFVQFCRDRARRQMARFERDRPRLDAAANVLDPEVLTIGFARRFAAYKRGTLLLRDPERLLRLLRADHPGGGAIQLVLSGKSHPGDGIGRDLIHSLIQFARRHRVTDRIVFLEDYDMFIARQMVQGCDVWLNTPIRGLEASGTSGMKAALNGVINASTLDGWWDEGFADDSGFAIPSLGTYETDAPSDERDDFESNALYTLLEQRIIPEFYQRGLDGVPIAWTGRMKRCILALAPAFSTHRMVAEYATRFYFPAHNAAERFGAHGLSMAKAVSDLIDHYRRHWQRVRIRQVESTVSRAGPTVDVIAVVHLGALKPSEVAVQVRHGLVDARGEISDAQILTMHHEQDFGDGTHRYTGRFPADDGHRSGVSVRIIPGDPRLVNPFIPGLIVSGTVQHPHSPAPYPAAPSEANRNPHA